MPNTIYINNDLTPHQIAILNLAVNSDIERLEECLKRSHELKIADNVSYYNNRINEMKELKEKLYNTVGMKRE